MSLRESLNVLGKMQKLFSFKQKKKIQKETSNVHLAVKIILTKLMKN